jgi:N-acetylglucosaminyl-diphospho-decaprenol L-rhamnosyltransferase
MLQTTVVIPTHNGYELLERALTALQSQTVPVSIVVVDNGSSDGTPALVADRFPDVIVVRNDHNLGFGRAVNIGARAAPDATQALVLVNNDCVCEPSFVEQICDPLGQPGIGMVAGVLLQADAPGRIDSAGIELDTTLRSYDYLWNQPVEALDGAPDPVGPCGGAAAYRFDSFREVGGFDEAFFAYWEDVDLALRLRLAGWGCALAPAARALHAHGQTVGAGSPLARRLDAFGRGYVLGRYRVTGRALTERAAVALIDWPALATHALVRRELAPVRERLRGLVRGRARGALRAPTETATVSVAEAVSRQWRFLALRLRGTAPRHFYQREGGASRR